jgi:hypothetical protein
LLFEIRLESIQTIAPSRGLDVVATLSGAGNWFRGFLFLWIRELPPSIMVTRKPNWSFRYSKARDWLHKWKVLAPIVCLTQGKLLGVWFALWLLWCWCSLINFSRICLLWWMNLRSKSNIIRDFFIQTLTVNNRWIPPKIRFLYFWNIDQHPLEFYKHVKSRMQENNIFFVFKKSMLKHIFF